MNRYIFLKTERLGFSKWSETDLDLAELLWGNPDVTKFICAAGKFTPQDVSNRLSQEIHHDAEYGVQYWPVFELATDELVGCCGLRPHKEGQYEMGVHLRPEFWRQGYGAEACNAVIQYGFTVLNVEKLFAGHNPNNTASRKLLKKLGFAFIGDEFYAPTGLYHPSYEMVNPNGKRGEKMTLELAAMDDLTELKSMYKEIVAHMIQNNIQIWDDIYPCEFLEDDIKNGSLYVLMDHDRIVGAFALNDSNEGESHITWENSREKAVYLDRLAVNVHDLRKGIGGIMLKEAMAQAKKMGASYLRLFVVDINEPAISLYLKNGLRKAEGIYEQVACEELILREYGVEVRL